MKLRIKFMDSGAVDIVITDVVKRKSAIPYGAGSDEITELLASKRLILRKALEKWIEYNAYVTVEFDTDLRTAKVIPVKKRKVSR